jgi:hypothetical protein
MMPCQPWDIDKESTAIVTLSKLLLTAFYVGRMAVSEAPDASYTVFIRLPFPRGDFVDPPAVGNIPVALWYKLTGIRSTGTRQRMQHCGRSYPRLRKTMILIVRVLPN